MKKIILLFLFCVLMLGIKAQYKEILNFNTTDGDNPYGSLTLSAGRLFGMTEWGGVNDSGCIFSIDTNGTGYKKLLDCTLSKCTFPCGNLTLSGSLMYGMSLEGGANDDGCIFSIDTNGTGFTILHSFNGTDGKNPYGSLTLSGNMLYGMTSAGGTVNRGCVFSIHTNGSGYAVLLNFSNINWSDTGSVAYGSLLLSGSTLYGMTYGGGRNLYGCIFSIQTNGTGYLDLYDFSYTEGFNPYGSLILSGSKLFGMTNGGGAYDQGDVFSVNTNGSGYKNLLSFQGLYGNFCDEPQGSLILSGKRLYGMTVWGGDDGDGNIYCVDTNGSVYEDLFLFNFDNGYQPRGDLTLSGKILYGMTYEGGVPNDAGVVFSLDTTTLSVEPYYIPTNVSCHGGNNGWEEVYPVGGCYPFTYLWSPGGQTTAAVSGLSAGTYTVKISSSCGHSATAAVTITQPATTLDITIASHTNISCPGGTGTATANPATGGTPTYKYNWSPIGGTSLTASNLSAGTYTITTTDKHSCTATASVTITFGPMLQDSIKKVNITCHGANDGKRKVFPYGGVPPYTYLWSDGNTREGMSGLSAGTYSCTVTDNNGCSVTAAETIIDPLALSLSLSQSSVKCFGGNTGSAMVSSLTGGTLPYTYLWAPPGVTNSTLTGASAGTYTLTVTDHHGCSVTSSVRVTQPTKIRDSITAIGCGTATVGVRGGTPSYNYRWTPYGGFSATAIVYTVGIYTVTITDRNGCTSSTTANIICPSVLKHKEEVTGIENDSAACCDKDIIVYPNPNNGMFTIESSAVIRQWSLEIYNVLGQKVYSLSHVQKSSLIINLTQPNGVYLYRIITEDGSLLKQGKVVIDK